MDGSRRKKILVLIDSPLHVISPTWLKGHDGYEHGLTGWSQTEEEPQYHRLENGTQLHWNITGPRKCIGFRGNNGRLYKCPERTILLGSHTQCGPCSGLDYLAECIRCNGTVCNATPERREQCRNTDYVIYIAVFAGGRVKVGVSTRKRYKLRWLEQGADFAGILQEVRDGKIARQIESRIGSATHISMGMSRRSKVGALLDRIELSEAERLVTAVLSEIAFDIIKMDHLQLEDLRPNYTIDRLDSMPHPWRTGNNAITSLKVVGEIVGMKGSILITRNGAAFQYLDLKGTIGYTIQPDNTAHVTTQSGLFDFFE